MINKRWLLAPPAPPEQIHAYNNYSPLLAQVLINRGFDTPERARRFLEAKDATSGRFLTFKGKRASIDRTLARIRAAIRNNERIVVYGDFDADGVTSTALLVQTLRSLGAQVKPYIPHRVDEGYGLNSEALAKLRQDHAKLVITVDCGIRSVVEVEDGNAYGLDLIVTDHHSIGAELPNALSLINPKLDDCAYTEDMLAGVGVAFRLAEALLMIHATGRNGSGSRLTPDDLLDLVAIGTVADLAPLDRLENRALVKQGLTALNQAKRPGVRALMEVSGVKAGAVGAEDIGFALAPRINAAGRLDSAMTAYQLLMTSDPTEALTLAKQLQELNVRRQELTRAAQELIRTRLEMDEALDSPLIFAGDKGFQSGIVGLVAGRLTEEFFRPAVVMEEGERESRASCRSIPQFDITHALDQCADLLVRHGGHAQAAGFTVLNENIPALKDRLLRLTRQALLGQDLVPTAAIDAEIDIHRIDLEAAEQLRQLEPTGHHNPMPVFMTRNARVLEARTVGKDDQHLKLRLARAGQPPLDAIGFRMAGWIPKAGECVDIAFTLDVNEWKDTKTPQLKLEDIYPAGKSGVITA
jgi:single-stranded-DNA-specific exonuclease